MVPGAQKGRRGANSRGPNYCSTLAPVAQVPTHLDFSSPPFTFE